MQAQQQTLTRTMQDMPREIQRMAEEARLGELRKVYKAPNMLRVGGIVLLFTGGITMGIIVLILFLAMHPAIPPDLPDYQQSLIAVMLWSCAFFVAFFLLPGCCMIFWRVANHCVYLCQHGFLYEKGRIRQVFRWQEIESIKGVRGQTERGYPIYTYKVRHQDGSEVKLGNNFTEITELVDILLAETAQHLVPLDVKIAHFRNIVTFTNFTLDQHGIDNQQERIPWAEVEEITLKEATAIVQKKGKE